MLRTCCLFLCYTRWCFHIQRTQTKMWMWALSFVYSDVKHLIEKKNHLKSKICTLIILRSNCAKGTFSSWYNLYIDDRKLKRSVIFIWYGIFTCCARSWLFILEMRMVNFEYDIDHLVSVCGTQQTGKLCGSRKFCFKIDIYQTGWKYLV